MAHPLDGARAKIERAMQHLDRFESNASLFESGAYSVREERDEKAGVVRLLAKNMGLGDPPIQLRLFTGEIAYQLRSALDHAIYLLAKKTAEHKRQFPIFDTSDKYKSGAPAMIQGVSPNAEAIINRSQPYHLGTPHEHPLWMLQSLNNTDKHRLIPASVVYANYLKIKVGNDRHDVELSFTGQLPKDGTELCAIPVSDPSVNVDPEPFCTVAFAQIGNSRFEPIVPFFVQAIAYVSRIIEDFGPEFP